MRVLALALPESPHTIGHLGALAAAGWDVHAVPVYPAAFLPGLHRSISVHHRTPPQRRRPHSPVARVVNGFIARTDRLALGATAAAARSWHRHTGSDVSLGTRWWPRATSSTPSLSSLGLGSSARGDRVEQVLGGLDPWQRGRAISMAPWLAGLIDDLRPDIVYTGPLMQTALAAYAARALCRRDFPRWLVSSWGIDLDFGIRDPKQRRAAEIVLATADRFIAECERDVRLARELGFTGEVIGVLPVGGGIDVTGMQRLTATGPVSQRRVIVVKGYQNLIGRAFVALEAIRRCAPLLSGYEIVVYAADEPVRTAARLLEANTGLSIITYAPGSRSYRQVLIDHGRARASIGLSLCDGLSTWALEAMTMGSFPIQSRTACLDEWAPDGVASILVHPEEPDEVAAALRRVLADDRMVDAAATINQAVALERFDRRSVVPRLLAAYEQAVREPTA